MANRRFIQLSLRCRVALIVFAVITLSAELIVHRFFAREYYSLNVKSIQLVALRAAKTGAQYLPANPRAAVHEAEAYAQGHGIARAEIISIELSSDNTVLTIRLDRKIARYVAVLAVGGLPARNISVTASARRQGPENDFGTLILDVPAARSRQQGAPNSRS
jgi:hypothetical protein